MTIATITRPRCRIFLDVIYDERVMQNITKGRAYRLSGPKVNGSPLSCTVEKNDYLTADICKVELSAAFFNGEVADDMFRMCRITVHMDDTTGGQSDFIPNASNVVFVGFADEVKVVESSRLTKVVFECRDYTSLLLSRKFHGDAFENFSNKSKKSVNLQSLTIEQVIREFLDRQSQTRPIRIVKIPETLVLPLYSSVVEDQKLSQTTEEDANLWVFITRLVRQLGLIAYIDKFDLVISQTRFLYSREPAGRDILLFEYGANVRETDFHKQLGIKDLPIVDVRSYNPATKTTLVSQFPVQRDQQQAQISATRSGTGQSTEDLEIFQSIGLSQADIDANFTDDDKRIETYMIPGIKNQVVLDNIARNLWTTISKHQTVGSVETKRSVVETLAGGESRTQDLKNGDLVFVKTSDADLRGKIHFGDEKRVAVNAEPSPSKKNYEVGKSRGLPYFVLSNTIQFDAEEGFTYTIEVGEFIDFERMLLEDTSPKETRIEREEKTAGQQTKSSAAPNKSKEKQRVENTKAIIKSTLLAPFLPIRAGSIKK